jgi:hypothetical protein
LVIEDPSSLRTATSRSGISVKRHKRKVPFGYSGTPLGEFHEDSLPNTENLQPMP